jgi:hypothetical protein
MKLDSSSPVPPHYTTRWKTLICRVPGVARPAGFRPVAWSPGKETACLVDELLALGEQEEYVAAAEELDPRVTDARMHPLGQGHRHGPIPPSVQDQGRHADVARPVPGVVTDRSLALPQTCHVGADPLFGEQPVSDAVELVAGVADRAPGRGNTLELALVSAAKRQSDCDLVVGGDEIINPYLEVGEGALDQLAAVLPSAVPAA